MWWCMLPHKGRRRRVLTGLVMPQNPPLRDRVHAHAPFREFQKYSEFLRENSLGVELYIGSQTVDSVTAADLRAVRESLGEGCGISVHGPFMDLSPGAIDSKIAAASLERYLQVMSFAEILRPEVVVFHSGYEKWKYAGETELWLSQSVKTWRAVVASAEKTGTKVAIENIVDEEPSHLKLLASRMDHPLFGLCLDVGHREIFSGLPISEWVDGMQPYIFELHLHDNMGKADDHLPVGLGKVDFGTLFGTLKKHQPVPVLTLEAHSPADALTSLNNLSIYL
jgi:sugar phosphate isomerase/epimerase